MTEIHVATDAAGAVALRAATGGDFLAGGTALQLGWPGGRSPRPLIDLARVDFGPVVTATGGGLRLAANTTLEVLRADPTLTAALPALTGLLAEIAGLGVRTMATLGGNVGWRAGDLVPLLLALGAEVEAVDGMCMPLEAWLAAAPVLIVAVHLRPGLLRCEKVGRRAVFSPSIVTVAVCGERAAIGGGAVAPQLVADMDALDLPEDVAATAAYRRLVVGNLIRHLAS